MIDEYEARKPNFDEENSVAIVLADGQEWWFPKPWIEIRHAFKEGKVESNYRVLSYGPAIDALLEAEASSLDLDEQLAGVASLAAYLLQWHYNLVDAELDQLLAFRIGDPESRVWFDRVLEVATGHSGPKVPRAGDV